MENSISKKEQETISQIKPYNERCKDGEEHSWVIVSNGDRWLCSKCRKDIVIYE